MTEPVSAGAPIDILTDTAAWDIYRDSPDVQQFMKDVQSRLRAFSGSPEVVYKRAKPRPMMVEESCIDCINCREPLTVQQWLGENIGPFCQDCFDETCRLASRSLETASDAPERDTRPDPLQGIRDAKYLNPVCSENGCQWLASPRASAATARQALDILRDGGYLGVSVDKALDIVSNRLSSLSPGAEPSKKEQP